MTPIHDFSVFQYKPLNETYNLDSFICGNTPEDKDLADFLKNDALNHQNKRMGNTTLVYFEEDLIAFFTTMTDKIHLSQKEKKLAKLKEFPYEFLPAVKIGRFAVHKAYQKQGIGTYLIKYVSGGVLEMNIACRFITVDAYQKKASWYERRGFEYNEVKKEDEDTVSMRFDLKPIKSVKPAISQ